MIEKISHYEIIEKIGSGGMGEVYLARDTFLNRNVALKILPAEFVADRKRLTRFLQEARLAAKINHPNICTIYEVSESNETPYISMEFIEGRTLAEFTGRKPLGTEIILSLMTHIADALDEAHRSGVIHRDIKSDNIIINRRGQAMILDFGLAKVVSEETSLEQAVTRAKTEAGTLVGTVQYMSPEQLLGKTLDGRTDLWSLGVLLFELASGELPFNGPTQAATFDEILHKTPELPSEIQENLSEGLAAIIFKLLEKDRDLRYQTASDLLADLKRLRRNLGGISDSVEFAYQTSGESGGGNNTEFIVPHTGKVLNEKTLQTKDEQSKRTIWQKGLGVLALLVILGGISFAIYYFSFQKSDFGKFDNADILRVTNLGKVLDSVISPDGKSIVYVADEGIKQSLWLKNISTGSTVQIVPSADVIYQGIAVSPDGNWVYYNIWDKKNVGEIFRIPVLGGNPQKVVHDCMPSLTLSQDGTRIAFIRSDSKNNRVVLLTSAINGQDEREILTRNFNESGITSPVWSPDGKTIAFIEYGSSDNDKIYGQLSEIPAEGGEKKVIWVDKEKQFQGINGLVWLKDKSGFLLNLIDTRYSNSSIWRINYPDGNPEQITKNSENYVSLSVSDDGKNLICTVQDYFLSVWVLPVDNPSEARRITDGKVEGLGLDWTPDGKIIYSSGITGKLDIWSMNADGTDKKQITTDKAINQEPCVSADGKYIFYFSFEQSSRAGIKRIGIDGKNPMFITDRTFSNNPVCSWSDDSIYYFGSTEKYIAVFKRPVEGKPEETVADIYPRRMSVSPDGKKLAYVVWDENINTFRREILSVENKQTKEFKLPETATVKFGETPNVFRFTADSKNLSFVNEEGKHSNVWLLPLNGGEPKRITNFNENYIITFAWSRDGKKLAVSRGMATSDAVLLTQKN